MTAKEPLLKVTEVTKTFGDLTILDDISFSVAPEEFVFLVGPSGAGKTTIFRLISREFTPTEGKILFAEEDINQRGPVFRLRRQVGRVFQDLKLISGQTVAENVGLVFDILGIDHKEDKIKEVLEQVNLEDRSNLFPAQLSEGEKQRVGIARALAAQPKLLLVDEPTSNLDPGYTWEIMNLLKQINKEGTTLIVATHDEDLVSSLGKRVIEIRKGQIIRDEKEAGYKKQSSKDNNE